MKSQFTPSFFSDLSWELVCFHLILSYSYDEANKLRPGLPKISFSHYVKLRRTQTLLSIPRQDLTHLLLFRRCRGRKQSRKEERISWIFFKRNLPPRCSLAAVSWDACCCASSESTSVNSIDNHFQSCPTYKRYAVLLNVYGTIIILNDVVGIIISAIMFWGDASPSSISTLDSVQNRAIRLSGDRVLSSSLESLSFRRKISDLCLFDRYYHGRCLTEISSLVPPSSVPGRATRQSAKQHPYSVQLFNNRTSHVNSTFFPRTSRLWKTLPTHVIPLTFNPKLFKSNTVCSLFPDEEPKVFLMGIISMSPTLQKNFPHFWAVRKGISFLRFFYISPISLTPPSSALTIPFENHRVTPLWAAIQKKNKNRRSNYHVRFLRNRKERERVP